MNEEQKTLKQIREKLYYLENKEKFCLASKKWRESNKDKVREYNRKAHYRNMENPEFVSKKRERCKYFKSCYQTYSDYVELDCKKGEKRLLIDGVFSCGHFKPKRRK